MSIFSKSTESQSKIMSSDVNNPTELPDDQDDTIVTTKRKIPKQSIRSIVVFAIVIGGIITFIFLGVIFRPQTNSTISGGIILPAVVEYAGIKNISGKRFTGIEATRTYKNNELIEEVKRVLLANGLPADIFKLNVPSDKNIAVLLKREFKIYHDNHGEFEQLRKEPVFVNGTVNSNVLLQTEEVFARANPKRLLMRQMLDDDEQVAYSFEMVTIEGIGETPDISSAGYLDDYVLLEEYAAAYAVRDGKIRDAIISIAYVFRLAQLAAEVPSLPVRFIAAEIRLKALDMIQNVVFAKTFSEEDLRELYLILLEQLDTWSAEANTFAGYRASGMKTFNLILSLGIEYAFEKSELEELLKRDKDRFEYRINQNWAWDQSFFLQSMQKIIGVCKLPYFERKDVLDEIAKKLNAQYDTPDELITSYFLLREVPRYMQFYALERTKCEIAALAMAHSLKDSTGVADLAKQTIEDFKQEPMTGKPYFIKQIVNESNPKIDIVWGSYFTNIKPFKVPDYSKKENKENKEDKEKE
ncbi:MAG: hypothetical protein LBH59_08635 [Planctomycetaceae bacterium]|jgi:hypothetical protein|nr:hypothetical protein [Planctomycetaceae bacterium]